MGKLGKSLFERQRRRWENNIKMDLKEIGCEGRKCMEWPQYRIQCRALVLAVLILSVLLKQW
jgi:hypothetical protein